jgi:hypothetical protein
MSGMPETYAKTRCMPIGLPRYSAGKAIHWPTNNGEAVHITSHLCCRLIVVLRQALLLDARFSLHGITNMLHPSVAHRGGVAVGGNPSTKLLSGTPFLAHCRPRWLPDGEVRRSALLH